MASEKIQKILSKVGISSRRKAETLIREGLVTVNGRLAQIGDRAEWGKDAIKVKGKLLTRQEPLVYLAFYKPKGVICALADPEGRPTLMDYLHKGAARVYPIGRLDFNSEGLLLLTNDGDLAEQITKSPKVLKTYLVKIKGHATPEQIELLQRPARFESRIVTPHAVTIEEKLKSKTVVKISFLGSGVAPVQEFFKRKGFLVEKVLRHSLGHLSIHGIQPGKLKPLKKSQLEALLSPTNASLLEKPKIRPRPESAKSRAQIRPKRTSFSD